ncbi:MAG: outer membrane protein assembly factor BamB family protein [Methanobacteriota archaeon]
MSDAPVRGLASRHPRHHPSPITVVLALAIAFALALPHVAAAPWLQGGYDAAKTGSTPDAGPEWDDVAFTVRAGERIPIPGLGGLPPVISGSGAFVVTAPEEASDGPGHLVRIDLATASIEVLAEFERSTAKLLPGLAEQASFPWLAAADDERFYLGAVRHVFAVPRAGGAPAWDYVLPTFHAQQDPLAVCRHVALAPDALYLGCVETSEALYNDWTLFVVALDPVTGAERWLWVKTTGEAVGDVAVAPSACDPDLHTLTCRGGSSFQEVTGLAVLGSSVVVTTVTVGGRGGVFDTAAWVLDAGTGEPKGAYASTVDPQETNLRRCRGGFFDPQRDSFCAPYGSSYRANPTGDATRAFVRIDRFVRRIDVGTAESQWESDLGRDSRPDVLTVSGLAFDGRRLFAAAVQSMHSFEDDRPRPGWPVTALAEDEAWRGPLALAAGRTLVAQSLSSDNTDRLRAFDANSGAPLWTHDFPKPMDWSETVTGQRVERTSPGITYGVGDGVIVVAARDGNVTVLGEAPAGLRADPRPASAYPRVGETVVVDLGDSVPGLFGPATRFRAEWGDGTVGDGQSSPRHEHVYPDAGERVARFSVANDAGQTASATVAFHVGAPVPTLLSTAFDAEHQNTTFFFLGLVMTGVIGILGVARVQARRSRLARELAAIDDVYRRTKSRPSDCQAALTERKAHARGLLADGNLEEGQFAVLERHIEELSASVRLGTLRDEFGFLPLSLAHALEEILADARITRWEHQTFVEALEREPTLPPEQKQKVRALIADWFARDAGSVS